MSIAPPAHTRRVGVSTDSWITPKWLIDRVGPFDLDPCACVTQPWKCADHQFTESENGLCQKWSGLVWCNPPYGNRAKFWLDRMAEHNNGIALVFARTETKMFFSSVWPYAECLLFLRGRLTFHLPDGSRPRSGANSGGPSVLIAYGSEAKRRLLSASDLGAVVSIDHGQKSNR